HRGAPARGRARRHARWWAGTPRRGRRPAGLPPHPRRDLRRHARQAAPAAALPGRRPRGLRRRRRARRQRRGDDRAARAHLPPRVADVDRWVFLLTLVAICAGMLGKARRPLLCLGAGLAVFGVDVALGGSVGVTIALLDLIYSAALRVSARALRRLGVGVVVC